MANQGAAVPTPEPPGGAGAPISVRTCSRIGLQASPPRPRLVNLLWRRS